MSQIHFCLKSVRLRAVDGAAFSVSFSSAFASLGSGISLMYILGACFCARFVGGSAWWEDTATYSNSSSPRSLGMDASSSSTCLYHGHPAAVLQQRSNSPDCFSSPSSSALR